MPSLVAHPMTTSGALSKRRRFQPAITNFFPSQQSESHVFDGKAVSHNHYAAATFSATPVVSEKVQSSLLSVGMRVRKSVADGYKTELSMKQEKAALPPVAIKAPDAQSYSNGHRYTELAPFSGISKYDQSFASGHLVTDDGDDYSLPPSSQESIASTNSLNSVNAQKRTFDSDDLFADWEEAGSSWQDAPAGRNILAPGLGPQRRRMLALQQKTSQPNMDLDDFEEAPFLRRREEVDADPAGMDCA